MFYIDKFIDRIHGNLILGNTAPKFSILCNIIETWGDTVLLVMENDGNVMMECVASPIDAIGRLFI